MNITLSSSLILLQINRIWIFRILGYLEFRCFASVFERVTNNCLIIGAVHLLHTHVHTHMHIGHLCVCSWVWWINTHTQALLECGSLPWKAHSLITTEILYFNPFESRLFGISSHEQSVLNSGSLIKRNQLLLERRWRLKALLAHTWFCSHKRMLSLWIRNDAEDGWDGVQGAVMWGSRTIIPTCLCAHDGWFGGKK